MIVVDTSALMALLLGEPEGDAVAEAIGGAGALHMSAATVAEALIVAARRGIADEMSDLVGRLDIVVDAPSHLAARRVADTYRRWGKGRHPAGLNFGDCFAYELAARLPAPLLFVGGDFSRTDIPAALR